MNWIIEMMIEITPVDPKNIKTDLQRVLFSNVII